MKTVRFMASILFHLSRIGAILLLLTGLYATAILIFSYYNLPYWLPIKIEEDHFTIFYPFTKTPFLLGDYTRSFLFTNVFTILFYGLFLWLLAGVFHAFRQKKLFTYKGVKQLSRFYGINLLAPLLFLLLLIILGNQSSDIIRIMLLHLVIGVFAFFMAAIFKQGVILQEEQDLTF